MKNRIHEERLELLGLIARETLGIDDLDEHPGVLAALEAAYDAGLWVGHSVGRGEEAYLAEN
ncbi:hypothetical protein ACFQ3P_05585 [Paraburkholderia sabiae]|uniref:Uncharacterized protein n=1 Tax=Paraburkholderia sabiae TaxID=273251 RepID=A0ABU9QE87_9BURK|nr:hypothetical protein [Paraburkholderia sabiae]WJZ76709.1 hypothetical protein QEN71_13190 [Paraburkholderia sabiae]CAD6545961.1 hypothetical protein LMG24235_04236 [Paraburkholderia sabiae]